MTPEERARSITRGARIRGAIERLKKQLKGIEDSIRPLGRGKYPGEGGAFCQVVDQAAGATTYELGMDDLESARRICGKEKFRMLFDRQVIYVPCEGFSDVAARVLSPAKASKILTLCEVPGKPGCTYVRWS